MNGMDQSGTDLFDTLTELESANSFRNQLKRTDRCFKINFRTVVFVPNDHHSFAFGVQTLGELVAVA